MRVEIVKNNDGVALMEVEGEVDMLTSPEVRNALLPLFDGATRGIVVDLSGVTYMDSSGIATMIEGLQWSSKEGKRFVVAGLQDKVMDVFVLTNLKDVFEFSSDPAGVFNEISGG
jgi:anti-sigma B factor antagonist